MAMPVRSSRNARQNRESGHCLTLWREGVRAAVVAAAVLPLEQVEEAPVSSGPPPSVNPHVEAILEKTLISEAEY